MKSRFILFLTISIIILFSTAPLRGEKIHFNSTNQTLQNDKYGVKEIYELCKDSFLDMGFTNIDKAIEYNIEIINENSLTTLLSNGTRYPAWVNTETKHIVLHPPNSNYVDFSERRMNWIKSSIAHELCHVIKKENEIEITYFSSIYDNSYYDDTLEEILVSYISGVLLPIRGELIYSHQIESIRSFIRDEKKVNEFLSMSADDFLLDNKNRSFDYIHVVVYYYQSNSNIDKIQDIFLSNNDNELVKNIELSYLEKEEAIKIIRRSINEE